MNPRSASRAVYTENEIANDDPAPPHASRGARSYGVSRAMRCVANQCREREIPTDSASRISSRHLMLAVCYAMVLAISFTLTGCKQEPGTKAPSPVAVEVAAVVPKPIRLSDEFNGRVASINSVEVRARVTGYVDMRGHRIVTPNFSLLRRIVNVQPISPAFDSGMELPAYWICWMRRGRN
jgi:hypothetical protein